MFQCETLPFFTIWVDECLIDDPLTAITAPSDTVGWTPFTRLLGVY